MMQVMECINKNDNQYSRNLPVEDFRLTMGTPTFMALFLFVGDNSEGDVDDELA